MDRRSGKIAPWTTSSQKPQEFFAIPVLLGAIVEDKELVR